MFFLLIQVYGKDGWPFIEDAAYRVLLDAILEKVEQEAQKGVIYALNLASFRFLSISFAFVVCLES